MKPENKILLEEFLLKFTETRAHPFLRESLKRMGTPGADYTRTLDLFLYMAPNLEAGDERGIVFLNGLMCGVSLALGLSNGEWLATEMKNILERRKVLVGENVVDLFGGKA